MVGSAPIAAPVQVPALPEDIRKFLEGVRAAWRWNGKFDADVFVGWLAAAALGGYLRLTTKPLEQPGKRAGDAFRQGTIDGAYWLRPPGPNCEVVIAYQGAVADEAIAAAGIIGGVRRDVS